MRSTVAGTSRRSGRWSGSDTTGKEDGGMRMGILYDWYITTGNAGRLCVLPERMVEGRERIRRIKCNGIVDAVEQLEKYEKEAKTNE